MMAYLEFLLAKNIFGFNWSLGVATSIETAPTAGEMGRLMCSWLVTVKHILCNLKV